VLGLGLIAAPFIFSMQSRAPKGADMIDEFRPFMTEAKITQQRGFMTQIDAAVDEARETVDPAAADALGLDVAAYDEKLVYLTALEREWDAIDADMTDMLDRMDDNLDNFAAVDALPPFDLFPWFFIIPGVLIAGLGVVVVVRRGRGVRSRPALIALVVLGLGLIAAPGVFQMFSRAPEGGDMIDDFRSLMTTRKVTTVQGYFVTMGNGEADLRSQAVPAADLPADEIPAVTSFNEDWPEINAEMAPVVGVMSDNVENFAAVDALPSFPLFPWFFVLPGLFAVVAAVVALRTEPARITASSHEGETT
jgi:hypothetical protein